MALKGVVRGKRKPPRVVVYGPPGVGKSTFGSDAPKPIFVTTEDGIDNLPVDQFEKAPDWKTLIENVESVARDEHDYRTIVIDTVNGVAELASQHVCESQYGGQWVGKKGDGGFMAWGQGWKATSEEIRKLLVHLDACRTRGLAVLLIGHTGLQSVRHPTDGEYTKFAPALEKPVWARLSAWADIILRADYEYTVLPGKRGGKGRAIGSSVRWLYCVGSAAEDAKCRVGYELPEKMNLSWREFESALGKGGSTLDELKPLFEALPDDKKQKSLAWMGVKKIENASLSKARQLLNRLRQIEIETAKEEEEQNNATSS